MEPAWHFYEEPGAFSACCCCPDPKITGREILTLAGKVPPDRFLLTQKFAGGRAEKVDLDEVVNLRKPGVERFMTLPKDQTEG